MRRSIEDTPIVFIGAGKLATNLAKAIYRKGFRIVQVYSRTEASARSLASKVEADYTTDLSQISEAYLYIVSLSDSAFIKLLPRIVANRPQNALFVHTAGSLPLDIWKDKVEHYGVLYPLQTFSKEREVDFSEIPIFIEASSSEDYFFLNALTATISRQIYQVTSEQRKKLHLAAVFACNFVNGMYGIAYDILKNEQLPFNVLLPLIDETASKVREMTPVQAQTGPAVRFDENIMNEQMNMLSDDSDLKELYRLVSKRIHQLSNMKEG